MGTITHETYALVKFEGGPFDGRKMAVAQNGHVSIASTRHSHSWVSAWIDELTPEQLGEMIGIYGYGGPYEEHHYVRWMRGETSGMEDALFDSIFRDSSGSKLDCWWEPRGHSFGPELAGQAIWHSMSWALGYSDHMESLMDSAVSIEFVWIGKEEHDFFSWAEQEGEDGEWILSEGTNEPGNIVGYGN